MRILAVDDHADIRAILRHMVTREGHEIDLAHGVHEATALLALNRYDAAVVDLMLPSEAEGLETIARVHAAGVPNIVLMTGALPEVIESLLPRLLELGVRVLLKPVPSVPELMRTLGVESEAKE